MQGSFESQVLAGREAWLAIDLWSERRERLKRKAKKAHPCKARKDEPPSEKARKIESVRHPRSAERRSLGNASVSSDALGRRWRIEVAIEGPLGKLSRFLLCAIAARSVGVPCVREKVTDDTAT